MQKQNNEATGGMRWGDMREIANKEECDEKEKGLLLFSQNYDHPKRQTRTSLVTDFLSVPTAKIPIGTRDKIKCKIKMQATNILIKPPFFFFSHPHECCNQELGHFVPDPKEARERTGKVIVMSSNT